MKESIEILRLSLTESMTGCYYLSTCCIKMGLKCQLMKMPTITMAKDMVLRCKIEMPMLGNTLLIKFITLERMMMCLYNCLLLKRRSMSCRMLWSTEKKSWKICPPSYNSLFILKTWRKELNKSFKMRLKWGLSRSALGEIQGVPLLTTQCNKFSS